MDNDNKINKEEKSTRHEEVLLFLNDELNRLQKDSSSSDSYNLETEYAKTKKNKSPFSVLVLLGAAVLVFLASWGVTAYITKQNGQISVSMEEFDGLNIKNLLDSVSKVQTNYDNAMKNKANIIADKEAAIKKAEEKYNSDLFLIESLNLDDAAEVEKRKNSAKEDYENSVALVEEVYGPKLAVVEAEAEEYKKQLDEYDTAKVEAAKQQEQALDSERRVQELERQKLAKKYEDRIAQLEETMRVERQNNAEQMRKSLSEVSTKYQQEISLLDPVLSDKKASEIKAGINSAKPEDFNANQYLLENEISDETIANGVAAFQKEYDEYNYMRIPMNAIPYKNSIPSYLEATKGLVNKMGQVFQETTTNLNEEKNQLYDNIDQLNEEITGLNDTIETLHNDITIMKASHEQEKILMRRDFEQEKAEAIDLYSSVYDGMLASAKATAFVFSADSIDSIKIYVIPVTRTVIPETGSNVEIRGTKTVKGVIKPIEGEPGYYKFEPGLDKNGEPLEVDYELITAGLLVKVLAK